MSRLEKIQQAILALPEAEYKQLRQWFSELDWEKWDREIEADSEAGKLDFLIAEALEEKKGNTLTPNFNPIEKRKHREIE